jgi:hypothetical protein
MRDVPGTMPYLFVAPQPDGYHVLPRTGPPVGPAPLERYDARGNILERNTALLARGIEGIPHGGSVLVTVDPSTNASRLVWVGASGAKLAEAALPEPVRLLAVSSVGNVLVVGATTEQARWFDASGAPTTDWFATGGVRGDWVALADGSVVTGMGSDRLLRFEPGKPGVGAAPDWFVARSNRTFAVVRGGAALAAAIVKSGSWPCDAEIEILTPAGESCGTFHLTAPEQCFSVAFGADRTVFVTGHMPVTAPDGRTDWACTWRWWTGLLR